MDRRTLLAFKPLWGREDSPIDRHLPRLTDEERDLYDDLRDNRIGRHVRPRAGAHRIRLAEGGAGSAPGPVMSHRGRRRFAVDGPAVRGRRANHAERRPATDGRSRSERGGGSDAISTSAPAPISERVAKAYS